jgi:hypothetical protein
MYYVRRHFGLAFSNVEIYISNPIKEISDWCLVKIKILHTKQLNKILQLFTLNIKYEQYKVKQSHYRPEVTQRVPGS